MWPIAWVLLIIGAATWGTEWSVFFFILAFTCIALAWFNGGLDDDKKVKR